MLSRPLSTAKGWSLRWLLLAAVFAPAGAALGDPPRESTPEEVQIGREVAAEVDRSTHASPDTVAVRRLNEIAAVIAPRTERPLIHYEIRLIKAPVVNAFSIPGGIIYFTDRLLNEARSDDELAGVMAHEIAHNARQHVLHRMHSGTTQALRLADLISLGLLILSRGSAWGQAAQLGVSSLTQSVLSANTVVDEKDADARAIQYLAGSPYSPVGFLTFLEHQATLQNQLTEEHMGFYRDHPFSSDRVLVARRAIEARGIPINRRAVGAATRAVIAMAAVPDSLALSGALASPGREDAAPPAESRPALTPESLPAPNPAPRPGLTMAPAVLYDTEVLWFLGNRDTTSAVTRRNIAGLNRILDRVTAGEDLGVHSDPDGTAWLADSLDSVEVTAADARANAIDAPALARRLRDRVMNFGEAERRRVALMYYLIGSAREDD